MILGYARVSTKDQNLDGQRDALMAAGAERIFEEKVTGTARSRPELEQMLKDLRNGDPKFDSKLGKFVICSFPMLYFSMSYRP